MRNAGIEHLYLKGDTPEYVSTGVRLATMHRVKGLEFPHVFVAGVNADTIPLGILDPADPEWPEHELRERCLLHVATSRARETLTVTSYGLPSPFLRNS